MTVPLEDIQDNLLDRVHAGERVDRDAVLATHPEHADALRRFFAVLDEVEAPPELVEPETMRLGEFRIVREIGRGGMGVVHEAEQTSLKRRVALKVLPAVLATNGRIVARFKREAEAAGRLRHPNIVPVYAVGDAGGVPFFAMEFVEGRSLADALAARADGNTAGLPPAGDAWRRWVVETIAAVADALHYAHEQGILHRDVKPANILLERDGTPRLTDFGLALDLDAPGLTHSGETFGTPLYMSPEQAIRREAPLDRRTDVYSLGVTLYETLTLQSPYAGSSVVEIIAALQSGTIIPPRETDPELPRALETIVLRALARDVSERYETAAALAADLRAAFDDRVTSVRRGRSRRPQIVATVVVLGVAAIWAVTHTLSDSDEPSDAHDDDSARVDPGSDPDSGANPDLESAWAAMLAGREGHEYLLEESFRSNVRMREVVSRREPGTVETDGFYVGPDSSFGMHVVYFTRWETQVEGGEWRPIRWSIDSPGRFGGGGTTSGFGLDEVLGDAISEDSLSIGIRRVTRVVALPPTMEPFSGGGNHASRPDEWVDTGGTTTTWTTYRTVLIYDDFPADYPHVLQGPEYDAAMRHSLTPGVIDNLSIGASRRLSVDFGDVAPFGPLPASCEIDLCRAGTDEVIATATWTRAAALPDGDPDDGALDSSAGISFWLREPPASGEQRFVLDVSSRAVREVRLIFRPSRREALEHTNFDRYWGGTLDVTLPVMTAGD